MLLRYGNRAQRKGKSPRASCGLSLSHSSAAYVDLASDSRGDERGAAFLKEGDGVLGLRSQPI